MISHEQTSLPKSQLSSTEPVLGLVVHSDTSNRNYVTRHLFNNGKMGRGIVVKLESVLDKLNGFVEQSNEQLYRQQVKQGFKITPANVLIDNSHVLVWHKPTFVAPMWFSHHAAPKSFRVQWPNMVFVVNKKNRSLSICATATASRPNSDTKVYKAPIWNLGDKGNFCLGSARLPKELSVETIAQIEGCVIDSQFTHRNGAWLLKGDASNETYFKRLRELEKTKGKFKARELVAMPNQTRLDQFIASAK